VARFVKIGERTTEISWIWHIRIAGQSGKTRTESTHPSLHCSKITRQQPTGTLAHAGDLEDGLVIIMPSSKMNTQKVYETLLLKYTGKGVVLPKVKRWLPNDNVCWENVYMRVMQSTGVPV